MLAFALMLVARILSSSFDGITNKYDVRLNVTVSVVYSDVIEGT